MSAGLGLHADRWSYSSDVLWSATYSANEIVFVCGEDHPYISAERALGLLVETLGANVVRRAIDGFEKAA